MLSTPTRTEVAAKNHRLAVRFFWCFLIGATTLSLFGNIAHAVLPYIPRIDIQIGAAAVPPIALLAAVHGIALAVRCGSLRQGLSLGGQRCCRHRRRRILGELSSAARPDASHRVQLRDCMDFPRDHRHGGGRQHHDAGCARGQTRTAYTGIRTGQSQCTYRIRTCFLTFETALSACGSDRTECRIRTCGPRTAHRIQ